MDDVFCKIIAGEISSERLLETDDYVVIRDIMPKAPVHLLVVSKKHIESIDSASEADQGLLGAMVLAARVVARSEGISDGYKLVFNVGKKGGQEVPHIHLHVLGGWKGPGVSELAV
ncbi:MAG: histidine triad nucleotide-binding protein [Candidatus Spechtbacterales bacterium]